jgi:hypothetical protein
MAWTLLLALAGTSDDRAPQIVHEPCTAYVAGEALTIQARFFDDSDIAEPELLYRVGDGPWRRVPFVKAQGETYFQAQLPPLAATLAYMIQAFDVHGNGPAQLGTTEAPIVLQPGVDPLCEQIPAVGEPSVYRDSTDAQLRAPRLWLQAAALYGVGVVSQAGFMVASLARLGPFSFGPRLCVGWGAHVDRTYPGVEVTDDLVLAGIGASLLWRYRDGAWSVYGGLAPEVLLVRIHPGGGGAGTPIESVKRRDEVQALLAAQAVLGFQLLPDQPLGAFLEAAGRIGTPFTADRYVADFFEEVSLQPTRHNPHGLMLILGVTSSW